MTLEKRESPGPCSKDQLKKKFCHLKARCQKHLEKFKEAMAGEHIMDLQLYLKLAELLI